MELFGYLSLGSCFIKSLPNPQNPRRKRIGLASIFDWGKRDKTHTHTVQKLHTTTRHSFSRCRKRHFLYIQVIHNTGGKLHLKEKEKGRLGVLLLCWLIACLPCLAKTIPGYTALHTHKGSQVVCFLFSNGKTHRPHLVFLFFPSLLLAR